MTNHPHPPGVPQQVGSYPRVLVCDIPVHTLLTDFGVRGTIVPLNCEIPCKAGDSLQCFGNVTINFSAHNKKLIPQTQWLRRREASLSKCTVGTMAAPQKAKAKTMNASKPVNTDNNVEWVNDVRISLLAFKEEHGHQGFRVSDNKVRQIDGEGHSNWFSIEASKDFKEAIKKNGGKVNRKMQEDLVVGEFYKTDPETGEYVTDELGQKTTAFMITKAGGTLVEEED